MASQSGTSRLAQMQMRFQQKQQEERAQRKLQMTEPRNESGDGNSLNSSIGPGKVRQMFDERRQRTTGIDKSYPLKPIAPRSSPASTIAAKATFVKKQTSIKQINGRVTSTNNETRETRETIVRNGENVFNNNLNGNTIISNKHYFDNEDSIDNGNYQDIRSELDNEILGLTISEKLPNLGKLSSENSKTKNGVIDDRNNNNNNYNENRTPSSNSIKLKPVIMKKTPVIPDLPLKNSRGITRSRNSPSPPKISSPISQKSMATAVLKKTTAKTPSNSSASIRKTPNSTPRTMASMSKPLAGPDTALPENMAACRRCGRHFNNDRIEKHEQICEKTAAKKRKIFDAAKHRVQGTEAERYVRKVSSRTSNARITKPAVFATPASDSVKKNNWRQKHEEFIQAIRAAKEMKAYLARGGKLADLPPPPPSENPDYIQCPHCSRRFNKGAADRHIPKCATMLHNKPKPGAAPKKKR